MKELKKDYKICSRGVWDTTVPGISFDDHGVSNYAVMFDKLCEAYPRGEKGKRDWASIVNKIKEKGRKKRYDCIIGVSGGTDSSYLLHLAKNEYGLRPLAVNLDNGWSSEIAVNNIKKMTSTLDIDLETHVIDYDEVKAIIKAYMRASLPWIDGPTDRAIGTVLYRIANKEGIKFILTGNDFRSEGKQPVEWTYNDYKLHKYVVNKYSDTHNLAFPFLSNSELFYYSFLKSIKIVRPFYFLEYNKLKAQELLVSNYNWVYYGGHHHENIFTKFVINYWLPKKFNINKKIITYSAQILNNVISREEALKTIKSEALDNAELDLLSIYVLKKLNLSKDEFDEILNLEPKYYFDYPNYYNLIIRYKRILEILFTKLYSFKPTFFFETEMRKK